MEKLEYEKMYLLERNHWWYLGKKKIVLSMLNKYIKNRKLKILDVGCGTGATIKYLQRYGEVHGVDSSKDAIELSKKRGLDNLAVGDIMNLSFSDNTFDLITCLDVLYHKNIAQDVSALRELYRVCKKGGTLVITDSACKALWSQHDIAVHARERYSKAELKNKIISAGFHVQKISYYNFFLFPLVFLVRKLGNLIRQRKEAWSDVQKSFFLLNDILFFILSVESFLLRFINLPFGVSLICVAKKR